MESDIMMHEIISENYMGTEITLVEIDGWKCKINDTDVIFPSLEDAKKEISRTLKQMNQ